MLKVGHAELSIHFPEESRHWYFFETPLHVGWLDWGLTIPKGIPWAEINKKWCTIMPLILGMNLLSPIPLLSVVSYPYWGSIILTHTHTSSRGLLVWYQTMDGLIYWTCSHNHVDHKMRGIWYPVSLLQDKKQVAIIFIPEIFLGYGA